MMFRSITIAALVGFVSANSYSIGCMNTLIDIGQNAEIGACLKPALLLPILVGVGNGPESVIGYMDTWLASMCGSPACSDNALNAVVTNITKGCSVEFGLGPVQETLEFVKTNYRTARRVACLKDGQVNCVTGTLRNVEALTGTMNLNEKNIVAIVKATKAGLPSKLLCTNCMKGAYVMISTNVRDAFTASDTKFITDTCGPAFVDGGMPPGLIDSAWEPSAAPPATTTSSATTSSTPTPTSTPTPAVTPLKKNAALGGPSILSSGAFMAISGLTILAAGMA
ncbi:hypothetical protein FPV67DRAFT_915738 [Lyophyllum atratum]|nr:hypothetical protein FPV67DRAFT_915738 [Lyophyllum atratum]